jgi:hypothetical protein
LYRCRGDEKDHPSAADLVMRGFRHSGNLEQPKRALEAASLAAAPIQPFSCKNFTQSKKRYSERVPVNAIIVNDS